MTEPRWLDERESRMWRSYLRMRRDLDRALERQLTAAAGLSSAEYALLVPLSEAPDDRLRARDLGLYTGWDRSRLSHQIRRMQQRGLVSRHACATDARGTFVQLTDEGLRSVQAAAPGHVEAVRRYLVDLLSPAEVDVLLDITERVSARINADPADTEECDTAASRVEGG